MHRLYIWVALSFMLWAETSKEYDKCLKVAGGATMDVVRCMDKENERLDRVILDRVERLQLCLPTGKRSLLGDAYDNWRNLKNTKCYLYAGATDGTGDMESVLECLVNDSSDFADTLEELIGIYCDR